MSTGFQYLSGQRDSAADEVVAHAVGVSWVCTDYAVVVSAMRRRETER